MKILSIDPSSNRHKTSNTGVVFLDNADLIDYWVLPYGVKNLDQWWNEIGKHLDYDVLVCEEFNERFSTTMRDNSVKEVIEHLQTLEPETQLIKNHGYKNDIPDKLLRRLHLYKFDQTSHHSDVRAAARLGLFWAMRNDIQEVVYAIGRKITERKKK